MTTSKTESHQLRLDLGDDDIEDRHVGRNACSDCAADTIALREFYMVCDEVWRQAVAGQKLKPAAGGQKFLCIGCLERRIGRKLEPADFIECLLNKSPGKSRRMNSRLKPPSETAA